MKRMPSERRERERERVCVCVWPKARTSPPDGRRTAQGPAQNRRLHRPEHRRQRNTAPALLEDGIEDRFPSELAGRILLQKGLVREAWPEVVDGQGAGREDSGWGMGGKIGATS